MTADASDVQGQHDWTDLIHVAHHERDVYQAGYTCLLQVLTGDNHAWDHVRDLAQLAHQIDHDVREQLDGGRRQSVWSPMPRGGTSKPETVPTSQIYGKTSAGQALDRYATALATVRELVTQAKHDEIGSRAAIVLIRAELASCAADLGDIADYSLRLERERQALYGPGRE